MPKESQKIKEINALTEHAIDHTHYKVYCDFCDGETCEQEYPSDAAEEAWEQGYKICTLKNGEKYVACASCFEKEAWKKWEK